MRNSLEQLRALAHAALLYPSPLRPYRPEPGRRERHGAILLEEPFADQPAENTVIVLGPESPERVFALAEAFFGTAVRYSVTVEVESATAVEAALREQYWELDEEEPALVLMPSASATPPALPELCIRQVHGAESYQAFREHDRASVLYVPSLAAALDPAIAFFTGTVEGAVVASARLSCLGTVAEITGVSTKPAQRGRGYGTALTWAAISEGRARGCTAATLTATAMGLPLYLRIGFSRVCTFRTFLPPE